VGHDGEAFVRAMSEASIVVAVVVAFGALIAWRHLPARSTAGGRAGRSGDQKSTRITTRRSVGRPTSSRPASPNMRSVPTWSSSVITFFVLIG
jgi:hypothetical protein